MLFDIDRPAVAQGYPTQSWDLIVAGGVLNAARDTERSLATLLALLKPGGWLMVGHSEALHDTGLPIELVASSIYRKVAA